MQPLCCFSMIWTRKTIMTWKWRNLFLCSSKMTRIWKHGQWISLIRWASGRNFVVIWRPKWMLPHCFRRATIYLNAYQRGRFLFILNAAIIKFLIPWQEDTISMKSEIMQLFLSEKEENLTHSSLTLILLIIQVPGSFNVLIITKTIKIHFGWQSILKVSTDSISNW